MASGELNIVVLGGSAAGLGVSHYLLKHYIPKLPKDNGRYKIILVNPSEKFFFRIASPRASLGEKHIPSEKYLFDLKEGFKEYPPDSIDFVKGKAISLEYESCTVTVQATDRSNTTSQIPYYALVIATGSRAQESWYHQSGTTEEVKASFADYQNRVKDAKSVIISGGGPVGVETAGELGELKNGSPGWFSSTPAHKTTDITLYSGGERLLPTLRPAIGQTAELFLRRLGVDVVHGLRFTSTSKAANGKTVVTFSDGSTKEVDIFINATGVTPNSEWLPSELRDAKGFVKTNKQTHRVDDAGPRVYAVGDVSGVGNRTAMCINDAVPAASTNIGRDLEAAAKGLAKPEGPDRIFKLNEKETMVVPVGKSKGVGAYNGTRLPSFAVWLIKGRDYLTSLAGGTLDGSSFKKESKWTPDVV
ncbi:FAD/NAD(P)-binding domain-containing protein [Patellaria atrata CBS 101060]|uniref:FAD/NAD(P)-binding domain-containing protein n=1 Tax=Patellaria atrata CBS 101060 TaxID=1346257 RepID=A0A9P4SCE7_9PEZI|nr:FAD/NAD(P)-binding domain-containing protein [Patellaria atrata CBS 101060]